MRSSTRLVTLAFLASVSVASVASVAPSVRAQGRPSPAIAVDVRTQLNDEARRAWDAAKQLAEANDYKGAQVEFQRAFTLSQNPRVLYNLGVVEKLLTHYARAVSAWEKELAEGSAKLTPGEITELHNAIAIVQQFVATIDVQSNEPDATLAIDDYAVGKTPFLQPVRIDVGRHILHLTKPGFAEASQQIEVASGQKLPVILRLEPLNKTGVVTVTVGGASNATVFVDGRDMGMAPFKGELSAERHTIEARAPGFVTVSQNVDVVYHQAMSVVLSLSQERHEGRLRVSAPEGAEIAVDQRKMGVGAWEGLVSTTGSHQVVVTKPGFQTYSAEVTLADDQTREVNAVLNEQVGKSWVAWGVGSLLVVTGGIVAGYFVFRPANPSPFVGDLNPGLTSASHGIHF